jgi:AraC-like DNA-binding protein
MIAPMQNDLADLPLPLYRLHPPYESFIGVLQLSTLRGDDLPPGSLLALEVRDPSGDWPAVKDWVPRLRSRFPSVSVILRVRQLETPSTVHHLAGRAGKVHVGLVLLESEPMPAALRCILTHPVDLAEEVREWLHLRGVPLTLHLSHLVGRIFDLAPRHSTLFELLDAIHESPGAVRGRFRKKRLPSPGSWFQIARVLHAALRIQARPEEALESIAAESGYHDYSALARQTSRRFGLSPTEIRGTVGWEWLFDRWLRRERVPLTRSQKRLSRRSGAGE